MRVAIVALSCLALGACDIFVESFSRTSLSAEDPQVFGVTRLHGQNFEPQFAGFNNTDPGVTDWKAKELCTLGYDKLNETVQPADPGEFVATDIRCTPYRFTFLWPWEVF
jgi:hypothetical protein